MPGGAIVSADFDGTQAISNRFRRGGFTYGTTTAQSRIEDIAEMRRGANAFHGRLFEDFRNTGLNANSWSNNARRSQSHH
jgi:hypothetical protein